MTARETITTSPGDNLNSEQKKAVGYTVLGVLAFIGLILAIFFHGLSQPHILTTEMMKNNGAFIYENPRSFKDFELLDHNNKPFTQREFSDKWTLVFFGFTYCPDICPTTLALLRQFYQVQQQGDFGDDLNIVMVTADPARDSAEILKPYIEYFHKDFTAVTGEFLDIHRFATQLNIPFRKQAGAGDDYTVDHSANVAIVNPQGHYVGFFRAPLELGKLNLTYKSLRESAQ